MAIRIGFRSERGENGSAEPEVRAHRPAEPRKSVVRVYFPARNMTLAYYNDRFDLHRGDLVYVDGKLEGLRGRVVEVNYTFKIKASDYKRVIAAANTRVHGRFFLAGSHFVTFDPGTLPAEQVATWYLAPLKEGDEFLSGSDGSAFRLDELEGMKVSPAIAERGLDYYRSCKVRYLCLDGSRGCAIVEGTQPYELEFEFRDGEVSDLSCTCFCSFCCKHEVAAMLQLRELLERIDAHYAAEYARTRYFAAIYRDALFDIAIDPRESGSFTLGDA